jgi:hypothetical protein
MKNTSLIIIYLGLFGLFSCKKFVRQQEENAILKIMTTGQWMITNYTDAGTDITSSFSGYSFQFQTNGTVSGIKGDTIVNGTWSANINNHSISSDFPTAGIPLNMLNAVWVITDSYTDSVSANANIDSAINYLSLKKE